PPAPPLRRRLPDRPGPPRDRAPPRPIAMPGSAGPRRPPPPAPPPLAARALSSAQHTAWNRTSEFVTNLDVGLTGSAVSNRKAEDADLGSTCVPTRFPSGGPMRQIALFVLLAFPLAAADQPPVQEQPILDHLNQAIGWYRRLAAQAQVATEPSDVIFIDHDIQLSRQAVAQAFDGARALATLGSAASGSPAAAPTTLAKRAADAA